MAGVRFELAMEPTAIGLVSLNSNSETHMTAICDARLIYGRGWISRVFICCFKPLSVESGASVAQWPEALLLDHLVSHHCRLGSVPELGTGGMYKCVISYLP